MFNNLAVFPQTNRMYPKHILNCIISLTMIENFSVNMCIYINYSINNCYSWSSGSWWDRHPDHHLPEQSMWILASWTWPHWCIIKIQKYFWWFFKTYCKMRTIFNLIDIVEKMYSFENSKWIEEVILHLVTSSTWCAQALFLRIGASPCQITRMCWEKIVC